MSGLVIDHGNPWYLSPNVWAVPTNTPDEPSPGELSPKTGQPYYLKANVRNTETYRIDNATVILYWANPATTITRNTATRVGYAFVGIDGGQTAEALCLTPWIPSYINQGHECLVAEVVQGPPPTSGPLDGQNDPSVAQHNLTVVMTSGKSFHFPFGVCNAERKEQVFTVRAQEATAEQFEAVVRLFGSHLGHLTRGIIRGLGFVESPCPDMHDLQGAVPQITQLKLGSYGCTGYSVVGELASGAALVLVTQTMENRQVGGLGVLILNKEEEGK